MSESRRRRFMAAHPKLGQTALDDCDMMASGPLGKKSSKGSALKNWKTALLACGSNAFSQNTDALDIMSSKLAHVQIPVTKAAPDPRHLFPVQVSCGSTVSACVSSSGHAFVWGQGHGPQIRIPTLISVQQVKQISCGATHIGLVTNDGKCFTWGNGENGMLGHGHKQNVASPQLVSAFSGQECTHISCGAYHTAVIADRRIQFVRVPGTPQAMRTSQSSPNLGGEGGVSNTFSPAATSYAGENYLQRKSDRYSDMYLRPGSPMRSQEEDEPRALVSPSDRAIEGGAMGGDTLMCGSLYTFGLGKAGQLGQGDLCQSSATPLLVASLNENGMSVARVSCGMHHTLIVALAAYNPRVFSPVVYSCGWGEHGRLGLGHEEQVNTPTQVTFSMPFHPTMVSAGEQHSLAAGRQGCYSWGSNSFGQCGAGNPNTTPFLLAPSKVPIPEGIQVSKIAAGGRHSAAVSYCGKLMTWGWGEEGQLGHGTEKNAHLPRPCKLPRVMSAVCTPTDVALGLCHTVVLVTNKNYDCKDDIKPVPKAEPVIEESKPPSPIQHPPQPIPDPEPFYIEPIVPPRSPSPIEIRRPIPPMAAKTEEVVVIELKTPILKTPAKIVPPHRSPMEIVKNIEDLMKERDDRKTRDEVDVLTRYTTVVETPATPLTPVTIQAPPVQPLPVKEPEIEEPVSEKMEESALPPKKPPKSYEFDPKLNTAHRAEVRRLQKLAREEAEALAQNNRSTKRRGSGSSAGTVSVNRGPSPPTSARRNSFSSAEADHHTSDSGK